MLVLCLLTGTATACGSAEPAPGPAVEAGPTPDYEPGEACPTAAATPLRVSTPAGSSIGAVVLGSGPVAVVLAHQSDGDLCQWMPYATVLAGQGYRAVPFDFAGNGSSTLVGEATYVDDIAALVAELRRTGVTKVVLMGASMGGAMSIAAATTIKPPVDALVSVSAPGSYDGVNAAADAPSLAVPVLYAAGTADGNFGSTAQALSNATPAGLGQLELVDSSAHGVDLLTPRSPNTEALRVKIEQFLKAQTGS